MLSLEEYGWEHRVVSATCSFLQFAAAATAFIAVEPTCAFEPGVELPLIEGNYVVRDGEP